MTRSLIPATLSLTRPDTGVAVVLDQCLGNGATGEVWSATAAGETVAVKWFFPAQATAELKQHLTTLAKSAAPTVQVAWPAAVVDSDVAPGFGVVLPLRPERFRTLADYIADRVPTAALNTLLAAVQFCRLWQELNRAGMVVTDVSLKDVALDPATGDVWLCNPEGLCPAAAASADGLKPAGPLLAPELVAGRAQPSEHTNHYTLAAVLLALLARARPDESPLDRTAWSTDWPAGFGAAVDDAPRPRSALLARWLGLPREVRDRFTAALGSGDWNAASRPTPVQWISSLTALRDALLVCPTDGTVFAAAQNPSTGKFDQPTPCPMCGQTQSPFPQVRLTTPGGATRSAVLTQQSPFVFENQLKPDGDPLTRVGLVRPHPTEPNVFGYVNQTADPAPWTAPDGAVTPIAPGKPVRMVPGGTLVQGGCELRFFPTAADATPVVTTPATPATVPPPAPADLPPLTPADTIEPPAGDGPVIIDLGSPLLDPPASTDSPANPLLP